MSPLQQVWRRAVAFLHAEYLPPGLHPRPKPRRAARQEGHAATSASACVPQVRQEKLVSRPFCRAVFQLATPPIQSSSERQQLVLGISKQERQQVVRSGTLLRKNQFCNTKKIQRNSSY
jgi:hypothetical protein